MKEVGICNVWQLYDKGDGRGQFSQLLVWRHKLITHNIVQLLIQLFPFFHEIDTCAAEQPFI